MELIFLSILFFVTIIFTIAFKKKFRRSEYEKLLAEIEKDFEEEFNLNQKESFDHSARMKELIEWLEDKQLEDEIEKRS